MSDPAFAHASQNGEYRQQRVVMSIEPTLKNRCPELRIACVQGIARVKASSQPLIELLNIRAAELAREGAGVSRWEITATREAYRALGKDPSRYRNSAEALVRRVTSGKGLYFINNLVDINNLVSLESFLPVGSYDLQKVNSPIVFRIGASDETYKGIGKDLINIADLPVFADSLGPFGSPTSDSERAMITQATAHFAMVIISFSSKANLDPPATRAMELLQAHAGATDLRSDVIGS